MNKYDIKGMAHCAKMFVELDRDCDHLVAVQRDIFKDPVAEVHLTQEGLEEAAKALNAKTETSNNKEYFVYDGVRFFALVH